MVRKVYDFQYEKLLLKGVFLLISFSSQVLQRSYYLLMKNVTSKRNKIIFI